MHNQIVQPDQQFNQGSSTGEPKQKPKFRWKFILIVLALAIIAGAGTIICTRRYMQEQRDILNQILSRGTTLNSNNTANWSAFKNEQYGYEVKYPNQWTYLVCLEGAQFFLYSSSTTENCDEPKYSYDFSIVGPGLPPENINEARGIKNISINGIEAKRYKDVPTGQTGEILEDGVVISQNNQTFYISLNLKKDPAILDKILFTFKFTQPETNQDSNSSFCTASPIPTAIGSDEYPINSEKYGDSGYLGQLFTASDCSQDRISHIFGVDGNNFTLGVNIEFKNNPSSDLLKILQTIGFRPDSNCSVVSSCVNWVLDKTIPLSEILKLKPYGQQIKSYDCINCG